MKVMRVPRRPTGSRHLSTDERVDLKDSYTAVEDYRKLLDDELTRLNELGVSLQELGDTLGIGKRAVQNRIRRHRLRYGVAQDHDVG